MPYKTLAEKVAANRRWRHRNPSKAAEYSKRWRTKNPEKARIAIENWKAANPEKVLRKMRRNRGLPEPTRAEPKLCECCGGPPGKNRFLSLDHCHKTGEFRGWLCQKCNIGIGKLGDNEEGVLRALDYLRRDHTSPLDNPCEAALNHNLHS